LLRPAFGAERAPGLALCAGLAVRAAVAERVSERVLVKWPNDVLAGDRKLAGVLVESQLSGARIASVVVGIGINVAQTAFEGPIADTATSLSMLSASDSSRERLLVDVLTHFETQLARLSELGMPALAEALAPHDALFERRLRVDALEGHGAGIDESGRLRVRREDGSVELCASGHVELQRESTVTA
jgi:BirA family transcriptional regulator, biotin operon repressor / biotin---[acetyl-CoA-carboxylase] ligase